MSEIRLFDDFSPVTAKEWKQKIQADLKGADYNETLLWESAEGIVVKPFYTAEDLDTSLSNFQGPSEGFSIGERIVVENASQGNERCKNALSQGVQSLVLELNSDNISPKALFSEIHLKGKKVYLDLKPFPLDRLASWISELPSEEGVFYVLNDIIRQLAGSGNWYNNKEKDFLELEKLFQKPQPKSLISVDISRYQNAGANRIQQLAYALGHAKEYTDRLHSVGLSSIIFKISADTNYFFEIAKLRALRALWKKFTEVNQLNVSCHILAFPTNRNKTLYDYNVNMLRTTTECMAAILGGADTVYNLPYDYIYHRENEFAERIARNQLLILKHESYFDKVFNAASGSYYIEKLTEDMVNKAWAINERLQAGGGFLTQLKQHKIQKKIKESAQKEQEAFNNGSEVLVGSNKYPNENDLMKEQLQKDPFLKRESRKTLIEPIIERRLTEELEKNRLDDEQ